MRGVLRARLGRLLRDPGVRQQGVLCVQGEWSGKGDEEERGMAIIGDHLHFPSIDSVLRHKTTNT